MRHCGVIIGVGDCREGNTGEFVKGQKRYSVSLSEFCFYCYLLLYFSFWLSSILRFINTISLTSFTYAPMHYLRYRFRLSLYNHFSVSAFHFFLGSSFFPIHTFISHRFFTAFDLPSLLAERPLLGLFSLVPTVPKLLFSLTLFLRFL